jgi:hypothetical protein
MPARLQSIRERLSATAAAAGAGFAAIGVAAEASVPDGFRHLTKVGLFDEVLVGRGFGSIAAARYVSEVLPGGATTPQVLVTLRDVRQESWGYTSGPERLLSRSVGLSEIRDWLWHDEVVALALGGPNRSTGARH